MVLGIEVQQNREYCFSQSEGPLGALKKNTIVFSCVFAEERIKSCHTTIKPISGVLQWCLSFCRFLPSPHMIMELKSDHRVLSHQSNQSPSPSIAQFGHEASSMKESWLFQSSSIKGNTDYMLLWSFNEIYIYIFFWTFFSCCLWLGGGGVPKVH